MKIRIGIFICIGLVVIAGIFIYQKYFIKVAPVAYYSDRIVCENTTGFACQSSDCEKVPSSNTYCSETNTTGWTATSDKIKLESLVGIVQEVNTDGLENFGIASLKVRSDKNAIVPVRFGPGKETLPDGTIEKVKSIKPGTRVDISGLMEEGTLRVYAKTHSLKIL